MTLKGQYALRDVARASFGARHENLKADRRILSAVKMSPTESTFRRYNYTLKGHGDTRGGCVAIGRQTIVGWQKRVFVISGGHNFGTFRAEANVTIRRHKVVYRLSSERKMIDLEWHLHAILMPKSVFCVHFTGLDCVRLERNYTITNMDLHCLRSKCRAETLVSSDIQLVQIFAVFVV